MAKSATKAVEDQMVDTQDDNLESVMEYSTNLADAERPEPLPVGEYPASITKSERRVSQNSGRAYLQLLYSIEQNDMPADYVEKWQKDTVSIIGRHFILEDTPQARYNAKRLCEAVGIPLSNRLPIAEFVGMHCKISINHDDDLEGNPRENLLGLPKKA